MRREGLSGRTVHLKLRYEDFATTDCSRSLDALTFVDEELFATARALLRARWCKSRRLRLIGMGVSRLEPACRFQAKLFEDGAGRRRRVNRCLDRLRARFGFGVVQRGLSIGLAGHLEPSGEGYRLRTPALSR